MLLTDPNRNPRGVEPIFTEEFVQSFWTKVEKAGPDDCWFWQASVGGSGYGHAWCRIDGKKVCRDAHRIAWAIENGRHPRGVIMHRCNVKTCCNPRHLLDGTPGENAKAALRDGLIERKLNFAKARRIVMARMRGKFVIELAHEHGVKVATIDAVLHGRAWSEATGILPREVLKPVGVQLQFSLEVSA